MNNIKGYTEILTFLNLSKGISESEAERALAQMVASRRDANNTFEQTNYIPHQDDCPLAQGISIAKAQAAASQATALGAASVATTRNTNDIDAAKAILQQDIIAVVNHTSAAARAATTAAGTQAIAAGAAGIAADPSIAADMHTANQAALNALYYAQFTNIALTNAHDDNVARATNIGNKILAAAFKAIVLVGATVHATIQEAASVIRDPDLADVEIGNAQAIIAEAVRAIQALDSKILDKYAMYQDFAQFIKDQFGTIAAATTLQEIDTVFYLTDGCTSSCSAENFFEYMECCACISACMSKLDGNVLANYILANPGMDDFKGYSRGDYSDLAPIDPDVYDDVLDLFHSNDLELTAFLTTIADGFFQSDTNVDHRQDFHMNNDDYI